MQPDADPDPSTAPGGDTIAEPAKLMRLVDMTRQILDELHHGDLDRPALARVRSSHREALAELREILPEASRRELDDLLTPLESDNDRDGGTDDAPLSGTELRLAEAQLLGWLEGLLKGAGAAQAVRQTGSRLEQLRQAQDRGGSGAQAPPGGATPGYR